MHDAFYELRTTDLVNKIKIYTNLKKNPSLKILSKYLISLE